MKFEFLESAGFDHLVCCVWGNGYDEGAEEILKEYITEQIEEIVEIKNRNVIEQHLEMNDDNTVTVSETIELLRTERDKEVKGNVIITIQGKSASVDACQLIKGLLLYVKEEEDEI